MSQNERLDPFVEQTAAIIALRCLRVVEFLLREEEKCVAREEFFHVAREELTRIPKEKERKFPIFRKGWGVPSDN